MGTAEERMRILKMLEEGKITAEEATRLLQALSAGRRDGGRPTGREARWLRVRVTDTTTGNTKVSINIPMGLVRTGIRMGARFIPSDSDVDYQEIMNAIQSGETGKILEVIDEEQGEKVEIWAE
ncbi:MAG: hypothetical protein Kow0077_13290 [Anaerolineae bacterium]